jgi:cold shock protein
VVDHLRGTVKWYNRDMERGYIIPDEGGNDIQVHYKQLQGVSFLTQNDRVEFTLRQGDKPWAAWIIKLT